MFAFFILLALSYYSVNCRKEIARTTTTTTPVRDNVIKMGTIGACEWPSPRVYYPNTTNHNHSYYIPRGFILHRCDKYSGCCAYEEYDCGAVAEQIINIVVYRIKFDGTDLIQKLDTDVISAINHTKCGCRAADEVLDSYESNSDHDWHLID